MIAAVVSRSFCTFCVIFRFVLASCTPNTFDRSSFSFLFLFSLPFSLSWFWFWSLSRSPQHFFYQFWFHMINLSLTLFCRQVVFTVLNRHFCCCHHCHCSHPIPSINIFFIVLELHLSLLYYTFNPLTCHYTCPKSKGTDSIIAERVHSLRTTTLSTCKSFCVDATSWFVFIFMRVSRYVVSCLYLIVAFYLQLSWSRVEFYLDSID